MTTALIDTPLDLPGGIRQAEWPGEAIENETDLARCWAQVWKIVAKQYRQDAHQLSIALDGVARRGHHGLENSNQIFEQLREECHQALRRALAAEQTAEALRRALWQFGDHLRHCYSRRAPDGGCNCGFQQALELGKECPEPVEGGQAR